MFDIVVRIDPAAMNGTLIIAHQKSVIRAENTTNVFQETIYHFRSDPVVLGADQLAQDAYKTYGGNERDGPTLDRVKLYVKLQDSVGPAELSSA